MKKRKWNEKENRLNRNSIRLLDLYCGAGGAAEGYRRAGFRNIVGVDHKPQKHYPFDFVLCDALEFLERHGSEFDFIHASPPCQRYSVMTNGRWQDRVPEHPDLIADTRKAILKLGIPYVIENVPGAAKELINPVMLCGTSFGLETKYGSQLRRHRLFECSFATDIPPTCDHKPGSVIGVYGGGQNPARKVPPTIGVYGNSGGGSNRDNIAMFGVQDRRDAMGIQWMTGKELSEAIPPAYTEWIGEQYIKRFTRG